MSVTTGPSTALRTPESGRTQPHHPETDPADTRGGASTGVRRRTLAKGAMWAVPAVALAVPAPAYAASTDVYGASVCDLFYAGGASTNYQGLEMALGISSTSSTLPQGSTFTWTVTMSGYGNGAHEVPTTNYSANARWRLTLSPASNTTTTTFTVTLTVLGTDVTRSELNCTAKLVWNDTYSIVGGTTVDVIGGATVTSPSQGQTQASSLSFKVAKRWPTGVNDTGRTAHRYFSKSGLQTCYPAIRFVLQGGSRTAGCGDGGNDTSTIYPGGACVRSTSGAQTGQETLPARC